MNATAPHILAAAVALSFFIVCLTWCVEAALSEMEDEG